MLPSHQIVVLRNFAACTLRYAPLDENLVANECACPSLLLEPLSPKFLHAIPDLLVMSLHLFRDRGGRLNRSPILTCVMSFWPTMPTVSSAAFAPMSVFDLNFMLPCSAHCCQPATLQVRQRSIGRLDLQSRGLLQSLGRLCLWQVWLHLHRCLCIGSRTALFFWTIKFLLENAKNLAENLQRPFCFSLLEIAWKKFLETFFLENTCACVLGPWPCPRVFLPLASRGSASEGLSLALASDCFWFLGLELCVFDPTSVWQHLSVWTAVLLTKITKSKLRTRLNDSHL